MKDYTNLIDSIDLELIPKLPKIKPIVKGLYFLYNSQNRLIYIGSSKNIYSRVDQHKIKGRIKFRSVKYIELDIDREDLNLIEIGFIQRYRPEDNRLDNPDYVNGKNILSNLVKDKFNSIEEVSFLSNESLSTVKNVIVSPDTSNNKHIAVLKTILNRFEKLPEVNYDEFMVKFGSIIKEVKGKSEIPSYNLNHITELNNRNASTLAREAFKKSKLYNNPISFAAFSMGFYEALSID